MRLKLISSSYLPIDRYVFFLAVPENIIQRDRADSIVLFS